MKTEKTEKKDDVIKVNLETRPMDIEEYENSIKSPKKFTVTGALSGILWIVCFCIGIHLCMSNTMKWWQFTLIVFATMMYCATICANIIVKNRKACIEIAESLNNENESLKKKLSRKKTKKEEKND